MSHKDQIKAAFADLRKNNGFIARMNYLCCQSCAWYSINDIADKKKIDNVAFYHHQDAEAFDLYGNIRKNARLHIAFSGNANAIVESLNKQGLAVDWDGNFNTRIAVTGSL